MECNTAIEHLRAYITKSEPLVNRQLREGKEHVDGLFDSLFTTKEEPKTLYRLLPNSFVSIVKDNEKDIFTDKAYISCSSNFDSFIGHVDDADIACLMINISGKFDCVPVNEILPDFNDEGEFILPRGHKFVVKKFQEFDFNSFKDLLCKVKSEERDIALKDLYGIKRFFLYVLDY